METPAPCESQPSSVLISLCEDGKTAVLMTSLCRQKYWRPRAADQEDVFAKVPDLNKLDDKQKVPGAQFPVKRKC